MYNYCVTFRIADKTAVGKSYAERRQRLIDNLTGNGFWDETTSFFFVESALSTPALAAKACQGLSAADDLVLVFDPSDMSASYSGPVKHLDVLKGFLPKLKKLP